MNRRLLALFSLLLIGAVALITMNSASISEAQDSTPAATAEPTAQTFTLLNLNTASAEDFLTIPDMNNRMVREFMEYRPYVSIAQFRQEIGKYVDDTQVAAWEKYVYVPVQVDDSDAATLMQIPGVTEDIANQLISARPFGSNDAFLTKLGTLLTADQVAYAKYYIDGLDMSATLEATAEVAATAQPFALFNLNTASADDFLTIPDMNNRMVREFMEYRPYVSIAQFRQEIGKYVDDTQVAAWEKYLYVPVQVDDSDAATLMQIPGVTEDIANQLISARPFGSNDAFLTKLGTLLTADQVEYAQNYLEAAQ